MRLAADWLRSALVIWFGQTLDVQWRVHGLVSTQSDDYRADEDVFFSFKVPCGQQAAGNQSQEPDGPR